MFGRRAYGMPKTKKIDTEDVRRRLKVLNEEHPSWSDNKKFIAVAKEVGCASGTVRYHSSDEKKIEHYKKKQEFRMNRKPLICKIDGFHKKPAGVLGANEGKKYNFTVEELEAKVGTTTGACYLTGDEIDLTNGSSFHLDHVHPKARGGGNTLENCDVATDLANKCKAALPLNEFFMLIVKILRKHGYTVEKKDEFNL